MKIENHRTLTCKLYLVTQAGENLAEIIYLIFMGSYFKQQLSSLQAQCFLRFSLAEWFSFQYM